MLKKIEATAVAKMLKAAVEAVVKVAVAAEEVAVAAEEVVVVAEVAVAAVAVNKRATKWLNLLRIIPFIK